ncbi:DciA family protein [Streptomyces sp. NPDC048297]|uniref:DciA family protein n=1 Tax=Streptomyces sp. NPDC048297 TaxID=3365531 RepID=UPI00371815F7
MSYDADSGQLTVCSASSAWATKARLEQTRISAAANQSAGRTVVRSLRILAPGTVAVPEPADAGPEPAAAPPGHRARGRPPRTATVARSPRTRRRRRRGWSGHAQRPLVQ